MIKWDFEYISWGGGGRSLDIVGIWGLRLSAAHVYSCLKLTCLPLSRPWIKRPDYRCTTHCQISTLNKDIRIICKYIGKKDCNHLSNSLMFEPFYWMVVRFVLHKDSISLILAITSSGLLKYHRQMLMYLLQLILCSMLLPKKKDVSQSLNSVRQWSLEGKQVSLHNLNTRTLWMFECHW